ncbi:DUF732 domain-containing protein [Nocardia sp. NPDC056611]|uniref:DUF732 domain-containing protein n=1 Tax=Nocardia sp. NPDC056611 TaxID=3345877 RepID=UPI00366C504F
MLIVLAALLASAACTSADEKSQAVSSGTTTRAATTTSAKPASAPGNRIYDFKDNPSAAGAFVAQLQNQYAPKVSEDAELAVHRGGEICSALDKGVTADQLVGKWTPMLTDRGARLYISAAVDNLCQDNKSKVSFG